jgi:hypothetical protein
MRMLGRTGTVLGLASLALAPSLAAQVTGFETFKWYIGGQAGVTIFETKTQTKGAIITGGAHFLVTAKRTGLILAVEEGFKSNQTSSYPDPTVLGGSRQVVFNNLRKYSLSLVAFPFKTAAQPYFGVGAGWIHTVKEYPQGFFGTPADADSAAQLADRLGGHGFGSLIGGVQFRVDRFMIFGQYMLTSGPSSSKLLTGPTHAFMGGLRIGLGGAREVSDGASGTSGGD